MCAVYTGVFFTTMLLLPLLLLLLAASASFAYAPTELYFKFGDAAIPVSVNGSAKLCEAAVAVFTPGFENNSVWCNMPDRFLYQSHVVNSRLLNARITLPISPTLAHFYNATARDALSAQLYTSGFLLTPANVTLIYSWNSAQAINAAFTSVSLVVLGITSCATWWWAKPRTSESM